MWVSMTIASRWTRRALASSDSRTRGGDFAPVELCAEMPTAIAQEATTVRTVPEAFTMTREDTGSSSREQPHRPRAVLGCARLKRSGVDRRTAIKIGAFGAVGFAFDACASRAPV